MPTIVNVLLAASALVALSAPALVMRQHARASSTYRAARTHLVIAALVAILALGAWQGWSFTGRMANLGAIWLAWIASGALALLPFSLRPRALGAAAGLLCGSGWLLASLWLVLTLLFDVGYSAEAALGNGLVCRESMYGSAVGDSGTDLALARRYGFLDHDILNLRRSDVYPASAQPVPPAWRDTMLRCHALIARQRGSGAP